MRFADGSHEAAWAFAEPMLGERAGRYPAGRAMTATEISGHTSPLPSQSRYISSIRQEIERAIDSRQRRRMPGWRRADTFALLAMLFAGTLMPFCMAVTSGSLLIPHNDDWVYRKIALHLYQTHHFAYTGGEDASLIGQVLTVQPLLDITGGASWVFGIYGILATAIAIAAAFCLARRFTNWQRSCLCAGALVLAPGLLSTAATFMTDIPALALTMACLALGVAGLDRRSWRRWAWIGAAMATGVVAFSIRQVAVAAPIAILIVALVARPKDIVQVGLIGAVFGFMCRAVNSWIASIPGAPQSAAHVSLAWGAMRSNFLGLAADLALALVPAAALAFVRLGDRMTRALSVIGIAVVLIFFFQAGFAPSRLTGNLLTPQGVTGVVVLAGGRPALFPPPTWSMILWLGVGSEVVIAAVFASRASRLAVHPRSALRHAFSWLIGPECLLGAFLVINGSLLVVNANTPTFDRYVWPLVVPMAILLVASPGTRDSRRGRRVNWSVTGLASIALAGVSVVLALNSYAFDAARWHAGASLAKLGIPKENIDAGYEWFGYHQSGPESFGPPPLEFNWYDQEFPNVPVCAVVSQSYGPNPNLILAGTTTYRLLEFLGPSERLYDFVVSGIGACRAD